MEAYERKIQREVDEVQRNVGDKKQEFINDPEQFGRPPNEAPDARQADKGHGGSEFYKKDPAGHLIKDEKPGADLVQHERPSHPITVNEKRIDKAKGGVEETMEYGPNEVEQGVLQRQRYGNPDNNPSSVYQ